MKYKASGELMGTPYPPLISIAKDWHGKKILLRLLAPLRRHLEPDEEELFNQEISTSKKTPAVRRKENLAYLKTPLIQVCSKYVKDLVRCQSGSKVLEELISCFYPDSVLENIAKVIVGVELVEVELVNEQMDNNEDDEENDDDEEEEEEEENNNNDNNKEDEEENLIEGDDDDDDDENDDFDDKSKKKIKVEEKPILPIQEDPIAHTLLKRILIIQATAERAHGNVKKSNKNIQNNKKSEKDSIELDYSNWENTTNIFNFAKLLLDLLKDHSLIETWLQSNRPCFAFVELLNVPSVREKAISLLKPFHSKISTLASSHVGAKILLENMK